MRIKKQPSERPSLTVHERNVVASAELLELGLQLLEALPHEHQVSVLEHLSRDLWQNARLTTMIKAIARWLEDTDEPVAPRDDPGTLAPAAPASPGPAPRQRD